MPSYTSLRAVSHSVSVHLSLFCHKNYIWAKIYQRTRDTHPKGTPMFTFLPWFDNKNSFDVMQNAFRKLIEPWSIFVFERQVIRVCVSATFSWLIIFFEAFYQYFI